NLVVRDDCLVFAGRSLLDLAAEIGTTPFYAYDKHALAERVTSLRRQLPASLELHYAIKANPMPAVVAHLAPLVDGFDVASGRELETALAAGASPEDVSFAGPGKSTDDLASAIDACVVVNLESLGEMRRLAALARTRGRNPRVAVRVNPDF